MKSNRVFILLIAVATILCLTACKKDVDVENEINNNTNNVIENVSGDENVSAENEISGDQDVISFESQFKEEIKDYAGYMTNIKMFLESEDESSYVEYGVSSFLGHLKNSKDPFASLSYMLKDVNNDGIDEIMLFDDTLADGMNDVIICMCTISGDGCHNVLNSQENMLYKLYENNIIGVEYPDIECINFFEIDNDMNFITVDSIDDTTPEENVQNILNKYKEAELNLNKVK